MPTPPQIVIGIPGSWPTRTGLVQDIALKSGHLFAGRILMNLATKESCELEVYDRDPNLVRAFSIAGRGSVTANELEAIASHTMTVYLIGEGGSADVANRMMAAARGMLRAGGIAVKVESTGKAHSRQDWEALTDSDNPTAPYYAYVTLIGNQNQVYSCGMHNLGLPDVVMNSEIVDDDTAQLLETFLLYTFVERPDLQSGHTFSLNPQSPNYRLTLEPCLMHGEDNPFFNPYGMWRMERI